MRTFPYLLFTVAIITGAACRSYTEPEYDTGPIIKNKPGPPITDVDFDALGPIRVGFSRITEVAPHFWLVVLDGSNRSIQTRLGGTAMKDPAISPDGTQVAFRALFDIETFWDVFAVDLDGTNLRHLSSSLHNVEGPPRWTWDGRHVVYPDREGSDWSTVVRRVPAEGGASEPLVTLAEDDLVVWSSFEVELSLSPAGDIAATGVHQKSPASAHAVGIYLYREGDEEPALVYTSRNARAPAWSPDGTQIAFLDVPREWPHLATTVRILDPGSGEVRDVAVVEGDYLGPSYSEKLQSSLCWSPDGSRLAFTAVSPGGRFHVFTVSSDGGDAAQVTSGHGAYDHAISCF